MRVQSLSYSVKVLHGKLLHNNREVLGVAKANVVSLFSCKKNTRITHATVFPDLIELLVANGGTLLEKHLRENPANAQYTSKFSTVTMIEAIDTCVERKLLESLNASPFFSILDDECQDVSTQEELSICFRWIVNGCPEEHFMTILHVKSADADIITKAITSYLQEKNLNCRKLVGQGYDEAATFSGYRSGVQ